MTALTLIAPKLAALIPRLASDADGEVVATARAIERQLRKAGADWHSLVQALVNPPLNAPEPPADGGCESFRMMADDLLHNGDLNAKERDFVETMKRVLAQPGTAPTLKQANWLRVLWERECCDG